MGFLDKLGKVVKGEASVETLAGDIEAAARKLEEKLDGVTAGDGLRPTAEDLDESFFENLPAGWPEDAHTPWPMTPEEVGGSGGEFHLVVTVPADCAEMVEYMTEGAEEGGFRVLRVEYCDNGRASGSTVSPEGWVHDFRVEPAEDGRSRVWLDLHR